MESAIFFLLALAGCLPLSGGFDSASGGPPRTALAIPPVTVDNPFWCPRRASP